ncbi:hypothetical protein KLEP181_gp42 [Paracoccus phage vB_PmaP_KLEP18-1]|nr:hypothetical protein KLEP181_gp42 [Paracoccus phage vB_PmaP_KLEP18-1]
MTLSEQADALEYLAHRVSGGHRIAEAFVRVTQDDVDLLRDVVRRLRLMGLHEREIRKIVQGGRR